ncbi:MAG: hypothetical protein U9Q70_13890 [Chloroflexota bacterium]|nr:hypothetical protein [Chloroflexota bacterium]
MLLRTLYQTLMDSEMARLRVIARQWGVELVGQRRPDLAAELSEAMARAEAVEGAWNSLSAEARAALEDLLRRQGALPWATFTRRWGRVRTVGPGRLEREELWREPISPAESLWYWGFLQRVSSLDTSGVSHELAFIPEALSLYLPTPPPLDIPLPESTAPPLITLQNGGLLVDDLVEFLSYVQNQAVRPSATGAWPARQRDSLLRRFHPPAVARLELVAALAYEQQWVRLDERELLRPVPKAMVAWLRAEREQQWAAVVRAWEESVHWNDLQLVATLRPDPLRGWPNDPVASRRNVLQLLRRCIPGVWYPLAAFVDHVREHFPDFLRPTADYDKWDLRDALTGASLQGFEAWNAVEGALLTTLLVEVLAWLGMIELGSNNPHLPPHSFCLSARGAAYLDLGDWPVPVAPPVSEIRPDGLLWVPAARRYERFQLSRVATPLSSERPGWYAYRLTPCSLAHARQQHISMERIGEFLATTTAQPWPATWRKALEHAYRAGEQVKLEQLWVLRVEDPELLTYEEVQPLLQERLGPRMALVRSAERETLLKALLQAGLLAEVKS